MKHSMSESEFQTIQSLMNNPNAPQNMLTILQLYGERQGYKYIDSRFSEKTVSSTELNQDENVVVLFDEVEDGDNTLITNMVEKNKIQDNTGVLILQGYIRFFLDVKGNADVVIDQKIMLQYLKLCWRAVLDIIPDQRTSFGKFKMARHFPVSTFMGGVTMGLDIDNAGAGAGFATGGNDSAFINFSIPIPWQERKIIKPTLTLPKWSDENTQILIAAGLEGQTVQRG